MAYLALFFLLRRSLEKISLIGYIVFSIFIIVIFFLLSEIRFSMHFFVALFFRGVFSLLTTYISELQNSLALPNCLKKNKEFDVSSVVLLFSLRYSIVLPNRQAFGPV